MSEYKRLTERDEYGNADIIGVDSSNWQFNLTFEELVKVTKALNRLADLEDKIKNGTLVEFNKPFYSNQFNAWCIYLKDGDYIKSLCLTQEQAEAKLEELQEKQQ